MTEMKIDGLSAVVMAKGLDRHGQWQEQAIECGHRVWGGTDWGAKYTARLTQQYETQAARVDRSDVGVKVSLTANVKFDDINEAQQFIQQAVDLGIVHLPEKVSQDEEVQGEEVVLPPETASQDEEQAGGPDSPVDGRIYTVAFFRDFELDDPANHGGLADPVAQFSAELQDAMDDTGLPVGFFKVIEVRDGSWGEWDQLRHIEDEPHDKQVGKDQETFDFGDGQGSVPAHRHINPDGTLGGWVADTARVSPHAYIGPDARVYGTAQVEDTAKVLGNAQVLGRARVSGNARVGGDARVSGNALVGGDAAIFGNARVFGDARVYGTALVHGRAQVFGNARVFGDARVYGTAWVHGSA